MELKDLKIRCINLDRSPERWAAVSDAFNDYDLIRIEALDGMSLSTGEFDEWSRPVWDEGELERLITDGNIERDFVRYGQHYPTEYAGGRSCVRALEDFLATDEQWTIIIEDDVEPVGDLHSIEIPDAANFYYLIGTDHKGRRVRLSPDGQVVLSRTFGAYAISRKAAEVARLAMTPSYYVVDMQIPIRCFESMRDAYQTRRPDWTGLERFKAYGQVKSIVKLSRNSEQSTFTRSGGKPWVRYDG